MSSGRGLRVSVVLLLVATFAGCYRWQPVSLGPDPVDDVRVTVGSTQARYTTARLDGDSVLLLARDSTSMLVASAEVDAVEERRFDWITSVGVGVLIVTGWLCIYPGC